MTTEPGTGQQPPQHDVDGIAAAYWETVMEHEPLWAHMLGRYPTQGRFGDVSRAGEDVFIAALRAHRDAALAIPAETLTDDQLVTRDVVVSAATTTSDLAEARLAEIATDPIFGVQEDAPITFGLLGLPTPEVADAMEGTLVGLGGWYRDLTDRHLDGLAAGRTPPAFAVRGVAEQLERLLSTDPVEDPHVTAWELPDGVDAEAWRRRMAGVLEAEVRPAIAGYLQLLRTEVLPRARPDDEVGLGSVPGGEAAYAAALRYSTTTDLSAQEIHDIGLAQVESLAREYRELGPEVVGTEDLAEIFDRLRTDPALHFRSGEEMVEASKVALARAEAVMGDWFEVVPQAPCLVQSTLSGAKAFYFPPASDGSRGGTFFINVDEPETWGTFELEAMAFHEGVPGHHLQLAIASELPDTVPALRRLDTPNAYAEGWGLYSERLSDEMGLYSSPVARIGMLSADSLRACRLVVDTGLHAFGWSRQRAIDYMVANSPLTEGVCRPEVDRYISSPGQATGYMIGRLEIQRMRREAEQRQGAAFDVKQFHSAVLDSGGLPLAVLDRVVRRRCS
jgi:uncharacterized protein (DUF885 family)